MQTMVPMCLLGPLVCATFFPRAPISHDLLSSRPGDLAARIEAVTLDQTYVAWLCRSLAKNRTECSDPNEPTLRPRGPLFE
jgi:hypothetical protein